MGSRQKFIGPKPKASAPKVTTIKDLIWSTVPEGHYLRVYWNQNDYPDQLRPGQKYRFTEHIFEALDVADGDEVGNIYLTAPFHFKIVKGDLEEDEDGYI